MKTNHRRGFRANDDRPSRIPNLTRKLKTRAVQTWADPTPSFGGHQQIARNRRGAKKRLRQLERLEGKLLSRETE